MATTASDRRMELADRLTRLLPTADSVTVGGPDGFTICYRRAGETIASDGDFGYIAGDGVYRRHGLPGTDGIGIWLRMAGLDAAEIDKAIGEDADLEQQHATFAPAAWLAAA